MEKFNIKELMNKSIDFIKAHFEYLLPFSLVYLVINTILSYIGTVYVLPFKILLLPLSFAIPYFAHKIDLGETKRIGIFFEIYTYFFKFFGIAILKTFIILFLFSPIIISILLEFEFDFIAIQNALESKEYFLKNYLLVKIFGSILLFLLITPLILFVEFFALLDNESIFTSFTKSYALGLKYYFSIIIVLIIAFVVTFVGMCTCIGLIIALPLIYLLFYFAFRYHISPQLDSFS